MKKEMDINELIAQVDKLVSVPDVYYRLESLIQNPKSTVSDFSQVLGADMDLCARLLNVANSAFYSFPMQIDSIDKAITVIGTRQIRELVLVTSVMKIFNISSIEFVDMDSFWKHSIAVGVVAKHIAKTIRMAQADKIYVPGLLHDIGRLALLLKCQTEMELLLNKSDSEKSSLLVLEENHFGFSHAEVGGKLLQKWNVPESIVEPVMMHHQPDNSFEHHQQSCVLHVADIVVMSREYGNSGESYIKEIEPSIVKELGLTLEQLDEIWLSAKDEITEISRQFLKH